MGIYKDICMHQIYELIDEVEDFFLILFFFLYFCGFEKNLFGL